MSRKSYPERNKIEKAERMFSEENITENVIPNALRGTGNESKPKNEPKSPEGLIKEQSKSIAMKLKSLRPFVVKLESDILKEVNTDTERYTQEVQVHFRKFFGSSENGMKPEFECDISTNEVDALNELLEISTSTDFGKYDVKSIIQFFEKVMNTFNDSESIDEAVNTMICNISENISNARFYLFIIEKLLDEILLSKETQKQGHLKSSDIENHLIAVCMKDNEPCYLHRDLGIIGMNSELNFVPKEDTKMAVFGKHFIFISIADKKIYSCRTNKGNKAGEKSIDDIIPCEEIICMKGFNKNFVIVQLNDKRNLRITNIKDSILDDKVEKTEKIFPFEDEISGAYFTSENLEVYLKNGVFFTIQISGSTCKKPQKNNHPFFYLPQGKFTHHNETVTTYFADADGKITSKDYKKKDIFSRFVPKCFSADSNQQKITEIAEKLLNAADTKIRTILESFTSNDQLEKTITENYMQNIVVLIRLLKKAEACDPQLRLLLSTTFLRLLALNMSAASLLIKDKSEMPQHLIVKVQNALTKALREIGGRSIADSIQIFNLIVFRFLYFNASFVNEVFWLLPCHSFKNKVKNMSIVSLMIGQSLREIEEDDYKQRVELLADNFQNFVNLYNSFGLDDPLCQFLRTYLSTIENLTKDQTKKNYAIQLLKVFAYNATAIKKSPKVSSTIIASFKPIIEYIKKLFRSSSNGKSCEQVFNITHRKFHQKYPIYSQESFYSFTIDSNGINPLHITDVEADTCDIIINGEKIEGPTTFNESKLDVHCNALEGSIACKGFTVHGELSTIEDFNKKELRNDNFLAAYIAHILGRFCTEALDSIPISEEEKLINAINASKAESKIELADEETKQFYEDLIDPSQSPLVKGMYECLEKNVKWIFKKPNEDIIKVERYIFRALINSLELIPQLLLFAKAVHNNDKIVISPNIKAVWKSVYKFRKNLMSVYQSNDKDSHQVLHNFEEQVNAYHKKIDFLKDKYCKDLKHLVDFIEMPILVPQTENILKERSEMRVKALEFIESFVQQTQHSVKSIFLLNIDFPIVILESEELTKAKFYEIVDTFNTKKLFYALLYASIFPNGKKIPECCKKFAEIEFTKELGLNIAKNVMINNDEEAYKCIISPHLSDLPPASFATAELINERIKNQDWKFKTPIIRKIAEGLASGLKIDLKPKIVEEFLIEIGQNLYNPGKCIYRIPELISFIRITISKESKVRESFSQVIHDNFFSKNNDIIIGIYNVLGQSIIPGTSSTLSYSKDGKSTISIVDSNPGEQLSLMPKFYADPPEFILTENECKKINTLINKAIDKNCMIQDPVSLVLITSLFSYLPVLLQNPINAKTMSPLLSVDKLIGFGTISTKKQLPELLNDFEASAKNIQNDKQNETLKQQMIQLTAGEIEGDKLKSTQTDVCFFIGCKKIKKNSHFVMEIKVEKSENNSILFGLVDTKLPVKFSGADFRGFSSTPFLEDVDCFKQGSKVTLVYADRSLYIFSDGNLQTQIEFWNMAGDFYPVVVTLFNEAEITYTIEPENQDKKITSLFDKKMHRFHNPKAGEGFAYNIERYVFPKLYVGQLVKFTDIKCYGVVANIDQSQVVAAAFCQNSESMKYNTTEENCETTNESFGKIIYRAKTIMKIYDENAMKKHQNIARKVCASFCKYALVSFFLAQPEKSTPSFLIQATNMIFTFEGGKSIDHYDKRIPGIIETYREPLADLIISKREEFFENVLSINSKFSTKTQLIILSSLPPFQATLPHESTAGFIPPKGTKHTYPIIKNGMIYGHLCIPEIINENSILALIHYLIIMLQLTTSSELCEKIISSALSIFNQPGIYPNILITLFTKELLNHEFTDKKIISDLFMLYSGMENYEVQNPEFKEVLCKLRDKVFTQFAITDTEFVHQLLLEGNEFCNECDLYSNYNTFLHIDNNMFPPSAIASVLLQTLHVNAKQLPLTFECQKMKVSNLPDSLRIKISDKDGEQELTNGSIIEGKVCIEIISKEEEDQYFDLENVFDEKCIETFKEIFTKIQKDPTLWSYDKDADLVNEHEFKADQQILFLRKLMFIQFNTTVSMHNDELAQPPWMLSFDEVHKNFDDALERSGYEKEQLKVVFNRTSARMYEETGNGESFFAQFVRQCSKDAQLRLMKTPKFWFTRFDSENGIDVGGLMREGFTEVCSDLMNTSNGIFIIPPDRQNEIPDCINVLIPNPSCDPVRLKCTGALIGAACVSNTSQNLRFPKFLWNYLYGIDITLNDIFDHDKNFQDLVTSIRNASEKDFNNYLNVDWSVKLATGQQMVIKEGKVSFAERDEYLSTIINIRLDEMRKALAPILHGFSLIVPHDVVLTLSPQHLEMLVCGAKHLTAEDVINVIDDCYDNSHTTEFLFDVLREFDEEKLKLFLKFVTGSNTIPAGNKERFIIVDIIETRVPGETPLPSSSTCFKKLYLAQFNDKEELKRKLEISIQHSEFLNA